MYRDLTQENEKRDGVSHLAHECKCSFALEQILANGVIFLACYI